MCVHVRLHMHLTSCMFQTICIRESPGTSRCNIKNSSESTPILCKKSVILQLFSILVSATATSTIHHCCNYAAWNIDGSAGSQSSWSPFLKTGTMRAVESITSTNVPCRVSINNRVCAEGGWGSCNGKDLQQHPRPSVAWYQTPCQTAVPFSSLKPGHHQTQSLLSPCGWLAVIKTASHIHPEKHCFCWRTLRCDFCAMVVESNTMTTNNSKTHSKINNIKWVFPKIGAPQNGWFGGTTIFGNTQIYNQHISSVLGFMRLARASRPSGSPWFRSCQWSGVGHGWNLPAPSHSTQPTQPTHPMMFANWEWKPWV